MRKVQRRNVFRELLPLDQERHPVLSALRLALIQRWENVLDIVDSMNVIRNIPENQRPSKQKELEIFKDLLRNIQELSELLGWVYLEKPLLTFNGITELAGLLHKDGMPRQEVEKLIFSGSHKRKGRPATARRLAIKALEKKLLESEKNWSWRELAQQFCTCNMSKHDQQCRERLRQNIIGLQKFMLKYNIRLE